MYSIAPLFGRRMSSLVRLRVDVHAKRAQNILFAQLVDPNTTKFSVDATRFMAGKSPMMFGLPGAALAMCEMCQKRKVALSEDFASAALTVFLDRYTEPLEFTFLFVATGFCMLCIVCLQVSRLCLHIFGVGVGMTFLSDLADMTFGIMQGNAKTHFGFISCLSVQYFFVYWVYSRSL